MHLIIVSISFNAALTLIWICKDGKVFSTTDLTRIDAIVCIYFVRSSFEKIYPALTEADDFPRYIKKIDKMIICTWDRHS